VCQAPGGQWPGVMSSLLMGLGPAGDTDPKETKNLYNVCHRVQQSNGAVTPGGVGWGWTVQPEVGRRVTVTC
jgi:hypothetical protein